MAHSDYQDTVAKMARKYSQYRLPNMTELAESDEDDNVLNIDGPHNIANESGQQQQHINDPYFDQQYNMNIMMCMLLCVYLISYLREIESSRLDRKSKYEFIINIKSFFYPIKKLSIHSHR